MIDSQINIHAQYGRCSLLAKRAHEAKIEFVVKESLTRSRLVNAITVTVGLVLPQPWKSALTLPKNLALKLHKLIAVNHLEGHLLSSLALPNTPGVGILSHRV